MCVCVCVRACARVYSNILSVYLEHGCENLIFSVYFECGCENLLHSSALYTHNSIFLVSLFLFLSLSNAAAVFD